MRFSTLVSTFTFLTTALAAPRSLKPRSDAWTIRNFTRNCWDADNCYYSFTIDNGSDVVACDIADQANAAAWHEWYNVPCNQASSHFLFLLSLQASRYFHQLDTCRK